VSRRKLWAFRIGLVVLVPTLAFGLTEGLLRLCGFGYPVSFFTPTDSATNLMSNEKFGWQFFSPNTALRPFVFTLPIKKPAGTVRICILGESAAMGTPDPAFGFGRILEVQLRQQFPDRKFEVVNAAMRGINSHIIRYIAAECARHEIDVFIIYMGNNEVVGFHGPDPDTPAWQLWLPLIRASQWCKSTRLGQALAALGEAFGRNAAESEKQDMAYFRRHCVPAEDWRRDVVCRSFQANLEEICQVAAQANTRVLLCTVPVNQKDFPPLASRHRPGLSSTALTQWEAAYQAGIEASQKGDDREALRGLQEALSLDDHFADLHFRLARSLLAIGDVARAREHYALARDWDGLQFRTDARLNAIIRSVGAASQVEPVSLLDVERIFAASELSEAGVPGAALFHDHVHPTFAGNYLLARSCGAKLAELFGASLGPSPAAVVQSQADCATEVPFTKLDEINVLDAMARLTSLPPFLDQIDHAQRQAAVDSEVRKRVAAFGPTDAEACVRTLTTVSQREPEWWPSRFNLASLYEKLGRLPQAVEQYQSVADQFPGIKRFRLSLGAALLKAGNKAGAAAQFAIALQLDPGDAGVRRTVQQISGH
jgi:tetratricopeptide (TPR) repeat protein